MKTRLVLEAFGASDTGLIRKNNEDYFALVKEAGAYLVADGLGGEQGGEVASQVAVETIAAYLRQLSRDELTSNAQEHIHKAVQEAQVTVRAAAQGNPSLKGMASTLVLALQHAQGRLQVVNIGDSRAYLYRNKKLQLLSQDHSLVARLVREGQLTPEEARVHHLRNIVTQVIGGDFPPKYHHTEICLKARDIILLCSDGLWDMLLDERIGEILSQGGDAQRLCSALIDAARAAGGEDNVTVIVIEVQAQKKEA